MTSVDGFDAQQLRALAAIADGGSLDAAARSLHVTPSAVSQRLRALERAAGRVLVVRSRPVRLTEHGQRLLRLARQIALLEEDAARELGGGAAGAGGGEPGGADAGAPATVLSVAVNADSLATWFLPAVAPLAADGVALRIHREDERQTDRLLRSGEATAAVTIESEPIAGCRVTALGAMRYAPMASPAFAARWFAGDGTADAPRRTAAAADAQRRAADVADALRRAPVVAFDADDPLQHAFVRRETGAEPAGPVHHVPSSADHVRAIELGFGWGLVAEPQATAALAAGRLVLLGEARLDVPLHWQRWALDTPSLTRLTDAVVAAARAALAAPADAAG